MKAKEKTAKNKSSDISKREVMVFYNAIERMSNIMIESNELNHMYYDSITDFIHRLTYNILAVVMGGVSAIMSIINLKFGDYIFALIYLTMGMFFAVTLLLLSAENRKQARKKMIRLIRRNNEHENIQESKGTIPEEAARKDE